jgi:hypothetical protein
MKHFIIPDIHENISWANSVLSLMKDVDRAVMIGDYFHQFEQDRTDEVCVWLKNNMDRKDVDFLIGNHDQAHIDYQLGSRRICSGWTFSKQVVFNAYFFDARKLLQRLALERWIDIPNCAPILVTHAGVSADLLQGEEWNSPEELRAVISEYLQGAHSAMDAGREHPWLAAGGRRSRIRTDEIGGVTWGDWRDFKPVAGIVQICGHTADNVPRWNNGNWCIDCGQTMFAVVHEDGEIEIRGL